MADFSQVIISQTLSPRLCWWEEEGEKLNFVIPWSTLLNVWMVRLISKRKNVWAKVTQLPKAESRCDLSQESLSSPCSVLLRDFGFS